MLIHLLVGIVATVAFFMVVDFVKNNDLKIVWWQWTLTVGAVIYSIFVLEVIIGFVQEGVLKGALVNGLLTGIVAIIWWVLLRRFIYVKST